MEYTLEQCTLSFAQCFEPREDNQEYVVAYTVDFCCRQFPSLPCQTVEQAAKDAWQHHLERDHMPSSPTCD